jgi:hypothetical protein
VVVDQRHRLASAAFVRAYLLKCPFSGKAIYWLIAGTHPLKIRCVCTDENAPCAARNLLKTLDTKGFTYDSVINTTTLNSVSSRTHSHTLSKRLCLQQNSKLGSFPFLYGNGWRRSSDGM